MSPFDENPKVIFDNIKELLTNGVKDRKHSFHTPVFSTNSSDNSNSSRIVVIRKFNEDSLTLNFNIPHGIASSITLVQMLDMNKKMILKEIDAICKQLGKTYEELKKSISKIPEGIYKNDLGSWNVDYSDLDMLTDQSFTKGRMDNNIVDLSRNDVKLILEKVLVKN